MSQPATASQFGYDFQTNAAIILMLDNMCEMNTIRVEGFEDIEIQLNDGSYILAQAKAVVDSSTDFRNVRAKSKEALKSLSVESNKHKAKELVYITNSPNPLRDEKVIPKYSVLYSKMFTELPQSTKDIITKLLEDIDKPLDTNKLKIQILPFETDDDNQKYSIVKLAISDFLGDELKISVDGLRSKMHEVWTSILSKNGTRKSASLKLKKKDMVWPIIVFLTGDGNLNRDAQYCDILDDADYNEINRLYGELISYYCERYDFATKVVADYSALGLKRKDAFETFINEHWEDYKTEIGDDFMDEEIRSSLIKVVLLNVLKKKVEINKIKRAVNL